jgi:hypothetical protein
MQDFPGNSQKNRVQPEPREKIKAVTSAETVRRKRSLGRQFKETFIGGDAKSASDYVIFSVIIPAVKDMFAEAAMSGIERLIYGENKSRRSIAPSGHLGLGQVAYNRMSQSPTSTVRAGRDQRMLSRRSRARHSFDELVIASRQEAEEVIDRLFDLLSRYGSASVADLYELTGIQSSHTDMKWGWTELRGARAVRLRQGGFLLDLPEPEPLG